MADWIYSFHRFADQAAATAAVQALGPARPAEIMIDEIGTLYTALGGGAESEALTPLPGWHVNLAHRGVELPAAWRESEVTPAAPRRVFA